MNGTLFLVATPIGNLQDITLRALQTLKEVDFIACEDTRVTSTLIKKYFVENPKPMLEKLFSFHEHIEAQKTNKVLNLLKNNMSVALVSDAGTPTISDPGYKLVRECLRIEIEVISIPGPSALVSALVSSGLPTDKFIFLGFLPKKIGNKTRLLEKTKESLKLVETTVIFYESPHKLLNTLRIVKDLFGNISIVIARELTKIHEEIQNKTLDEFIEYYSKNAIRGEFTVLFNLK